VSYGALAAKLGMLRAVGHANGSNPIKRRPALSPPDRRQRFAGEVWRRAASAGMLQHEGVVIGPASAGEAQPFQPE
jgi:hypothetical protein